MELSLSEQRVGTYALVVAVAIGIPVYLRRHLFLDGSVSSLDAIVNPDGMRLKGEEDERLDRTILQADRNAMPQIS